MRNVKKNMQSFYYATYSDEITIYEKDDTGNIKYTEVDGELIPIPIGTQAGYNNPVLMRANISAGKGNMDVTVFGSNVDFSRVISTTDRICPINKLTRIWIDNEIKYNEDGTVDGDSADYEVCAKPAKSLNSILIAIKLLPEGERNA